MIRSLILDVDGTLMDTNYLHVEAWAAALEAVGRLIPRAEIHKQIGKSGEKLVAEFVAGRAIAQRADALHTEAYKKIQQRGHPLPGARELIATMPQKGMQLWLATSAKPEELKHHLTELAADGKLAGVVSSGDVEEGKPEPDIFALALERSRVAADESIVLGDTIWDIVAAQRCGLRIACVLTGGAFSGRELKDAGAIAVYKNCAEALAMGFPEVVGDGGSYRATNF
jgi:HAD superfamily hydrolase (TIGR01509 family)